MAVSKMCGTSFVEGAAQKIARNKGQPYEVSGAACLHVGMGVIPISEGHAPHALPFLDELPNCADDVLVQRVVAQQLQ